MGAAESYTEHWRLLFLEVLKHNPGPGPSFLCASSHPLWFVVSVVALTVKIRSYEEHMQKHRKVNLGRRSQLNTSSQARGV